VEYGLIAIRHIAAQRPGTVVAAKEIAQVYGIPYEMLAKVLQKLTRQGLIESFHGVNGGYRLTKSPDEVRVSSIINAIEGAAPMITQCLAHGPDSCDIFSVCTIKTPLLKVQENIELAFHRMTLAEIV
jgi:Rrf2 family protein